MFRFSPIDVGACSQRTMTVSEAVPGDAVIPAWPFAGDSGLVGLMWVSSPGIVTVRVCRIASGKPDATQGVYAATIVKGL